MTQFQLWDLDLLNLQFGFLSKLYCKGSSCAIILVDIIDDSKIEGLWHWARTLREIDSYLPILIVGYNFDNDQPENESAVMKKVEFLKKELSIEHFQAIFNFTKNSVTRLFGVLFEIVRAPWL